MKPDTPEKSAKLKKLLTLGGIVAAVIIALIAIGVTVGSTKQAKKDPNFVSSTNAKSISGLAIKAANVHDYTRQDVSAKQLAEFSDQQQQEGLAAYYTLEGSVNYYVGSTDNGNYVNILWGTLGKSWSLDNYIKVAQNYLNQQAASTGGSIAITKDGSLNVSGSDGKQYTVPCLDVTETDSDGSIGFAFFSCIGPMGSSQRFISFTATTSDNSIDSGKALIQKFANAVTVQFK